MPRSCRGQLTTSRAAAGHTGPFNELTANGVMEPARLYESPYTDHTPQALNRCSRKQTSTASSTSSTL
jgi:hypothetical protein